MMQSCSVPVVLDENPEGGFDYLATPSCERFRSLFTPANEVIMHMQVACSTLILLYITDERAPSHLLRVLGGHACCTLACSRSACACRSSDLHVKLAGSMQSSDGIGQRQHALGHDSYH